VETPDTAVRIVGWALRDGAGGDRFRASEGIPAICGADKTKQAGRFLVDHDHVAVDERDGHGELVRLLVKRSLYPGNTPVGRIREPEPNGRLIEVHPADIDTVVERAPGKVVYPHPLFVRTGVAGRL